MFLRHQHPWAPQLAMSRAVATEGPRARVSPGLKRGTGQGPNAVVTGYVPRKTIAGMQPNWFVEGRSGAEALGSMPGDRIVGTGRDPIATFGRDRAIAIVAAVMAQPKANRKAVLRTALERIHPGLSATVEAKASLFQQVKGFQAREALTRAIAASLSNQFLQSAKSGAPLPMGDCRCGTGDYIATGDTSALTFSAVSPGSGLTPASTMQSAMLFQPVTCPAGLYPDKAGMKCVPPPPPPSGASNLPAGVAPRVIAGFTVPAGSVVSFNAATGQTSITPFTLTGSLASRYSVMAATNDQQGISVRSGQYPFATQEGKKIYYNSNTRRLGIGGDFGTGIAGPIADAGKAVIGAAGDLVSGVLNAACAVANLPGAQAAANIAAPGSGAAMASSGSACSQSRADEQAYVEQPQAGGMSTNTWLLIGGAGLAAVLLLK